jgi:hypothetical protein
LPGPIGQGVPAWEVKFVRNFAPTDGCRGAKPQWRRHVAFISRGGTPPEKPLSAPDQPAPRMPRAVDPVFARDGHSCCDWPNPYLGAGLRLGEIQL